MDQNTNYITFEMNIKLQMKDYRIILGLEKTWIVAIAVGLVQIIVFAIKSQGRI